MFLAFFDGSITPHTPDDDFYQLVMSCVGVLTRLLPKNGEIKKFADTCETLLTGGEYNNQQAAI